MNNTYPELLREIEEIVWGTESDIAKVHAIQGLLYTWDQMQDNKTEQMFRVATKDDIQYSDDYTPGLDHSVLKK